MPQIVQWASQPIVILTNELTSASFTWNDNPTVKAFALGDALEIVIRAQYRDAYGGDAEFEWYIERQKEGPMAPGAPDSGWIPVYHEKPYLTCPAGDHETVYSRDYRYTIPVDDNVVTFRIRARIVQGGSLPTGGSGSLGNWTAFDVRQFTAFVSFVGDFSLDYVPVTILYGPPGQDMLNGLRQIESYQTRMCVGFTKSVGTRNTESVTVNGGVRVSTGFISVSGSASGGQSTYDEESVQSESTSIFTAKYTWGTTLLADNQRLIGRSFWGPLSDIFVILKNPWFTIKGTPEGLQLGVSDRSISQTDLLYVAANRLLRPGDDPIAARIPAPARRRMLELDPFICNLDDFFPHDKGLPLEHAVNPYQDPSVGNPGTQTGLNRAARLARLSLGAAVQLDVELTGDLVVSDTRTNVTSYASEVQESSSGTLGLGLFFGALEVGASESSATGSFVKLSYLKSSEAQIGRIQTAFCRLVRNQNQADLGDLELWWDKQFSTFMFRNAPPCVPITVKTPTGAPLTICRDHVVLGAVRGPTGRDLPNIRVKLLEVPSGRFVAETMSDHQGRFEFRGVTPGNYRLLGGDQVQDLQLGPRLRDTPRLVELLRVRRVVDLKDSVLWEFAEALDVDPGKARAVLRKLRAIKNLDRVILQRVLRESAIAPEAVEKRSVIDLDRH